MYVRICLSVCLSARISQNHISNFTIFSVHVNWLRLGPPVTTILFTSSFVVDYMFSHNAANGAESLAVLLRRVRQVTAPGASLMSITALFPLLYKTFISHRKYKLAVHYTSTIQLATWFHLRKILLHAWRVAHLSFERYLYTANKSYEFLMSHLEGQEPGAEQAEQCW